MTYVKISETLIPAVVTGRLRDHTWDERASKYLRLEVTAASAAALFKDNVSWGIVDNDSGQAEYYDNSEYSVAGEIIDHRDGTVTVKMGKPTPYEELLKISLTSAALESAYREGVNSYGYE